MQSWELAVKISRRDVLCTACMGAVAACTEPSPAPPGIGNDTDTDTDSNVDTDTDTQPQGFDPCVDPGTGPGWVEVRFSDYPGLDQLYGSAYLTLGGRQVVIAHVEQDCYVALERPCSHEGVLIEYREKRNGFVCPRHGAIYGWDGRVIAGPPPADLQYFPCGPRNGSLWVNIG